MTSALHSQLRKESINISLIPTLKFVGIGVLWIVLSDLALFLTQNRVSSHFPIFHIEVFKGILFVIAMGVFFFFMQQRNDLVSNEIFHLDFFRKNSQAMLIYNLETMEILDVNDAAISLYGFTRDEFLSLKISDIRSANDTPPLIHSIDHLQNGYRFIGNSKHFHKNGTVVNCEISAFSIKYDRDRVGLITATNLNSQAKAEAALIEVTKVHEKQISDRLYELALYNRELQIRMKEIGANNDDLIEVTNLLQYSSRSTVARYEAKLQRTQSFIYLCMENVSDAVWTIDVNDPAETFINERALALFGCSRRAIFDQPNFWEDYVHTDDRNRIKNELLALNKADRLEIFYRHRTIGKIISQKIQLTRDENEKVEKIVCFAKINDPQATA